MRKPCLETRLTRVRIIQAGEELWYIFGLPLVLETCP